MTDGHASLARELGKLTRRQAFGAVAGGALLGSAWAAVFRDAVLADHRARVTLVRAGSTLGALVTYRGHRIMLIQAADAADVDTVTELAAGFMRRRIDALLLPASAARRISRAYRDRWRLGGIWTVPDVDDGTSISLAGRALRIGQLHIEADSLPQGAWQVSTPPPAPWYVAVTVGRARVTIASDRAAVARLPLDAALVNAVACGDTELRSAGIAPEIALLAVPAGTIEPAPDGPRIVALASGTPIALDLRDNAIELPRSG